MRRHHLSLQRLSVASRCNPHIASGSTRLQEDVFLLVTCPSAGGARPSSSHGYRGKLHDCDSMKSL
jgi:hypothetical protein